jgi:hypothetical protein
MSGHVSSTCDTAIDICHQSSKQSGWSSSLVWSGLLQCVLPLQQTTHFVACKDNCVGALPPNLASIRDKFQLCSILLYYSAENKSFNL